MFENVTTTSGSKKTMATEESCNDKWQSLPIEKSDACATEEEEYPAGTTRFECQVAGHPFDPKKNKIGKYSET